MSIAGADLTSKFALDVQSVSQLRLEAKQSSPEALKQVAQQFGLRIAHTFYGAALSAAHGAQRGEVDGRQAEVAARNGIAVRIVGGIAELGRQGIGLGRGHPVLAPLGQGVPFALPQAGRWYPPNMQGLVMGLAGAGNVGVVIAQNLTMNSQRLLCYGNCFLIFARLVKLNHPPI